MRIHYCRKVSRAHSTFPPYWVDRNYANRLDTISSDFDVCVVYARTATGKRTVGNAENTLHVFVREQDKSGGEGGKCGVYRTL